MIKSLLATLTVCGALMLSAASLVGTGAVKLPQAVDANPPAGTDEQPQLWAGTALEKAQSARGRDDCNGNGVPDDEDIANGTSQDCNQNGVPDECDVMPALIYPIVPGDQWKYTFTDPGADWTAPDYDDSWWEVGNAPFGNTTGGDFAYQTYWPANTDPWLRKTIQLPAPLPLVAYVGVDNGFDLYANGVHVSGANAEGGTWRWEYIFDVPAELLDAGTNLIAVRLEDHGGETAFDMQLEGLPAPLSQDCNQNGVPDECDIDGGSSSDCQANGVPDECDIANGSSADANGNGVPDECELVSDFVDAVSRLFSFLNESVAELLFDDVVSREFSFNNFSPIGLNFADAVAREFSFFNATPPVLNFAGAVSREFSFENETHVTYQTTNTVSREFSFQNDAPPVLEFTDTVSREFSFENDFVDIVFPVDALSREFSFENKHVVVVEYGDAVSREFSYYVSGPDLVVNWVSAAPTPVLAGQLADISWMVRNAGPNTATETQWVDRVLLSLDASVGNDITLGELPHPGPLAPGATYTAALSVQIPLSATGDYYVLVMTDASGDVDELENENNNTGATPSPVHVQAPNLQPVSIVAPVTGQTDEPVSITYRVRNVGDGAVAGTWVDRVYISADQTWDSNDAQVGGEQIISGPLEAGAEYVRPVTFAAPHLPGVYWVIVKIDATNQVIEPAAGGENNTLADDAPISVTQAPRPNLIVTSITPPDNLLPGTLVEVAWTIKNAGDAPAVGTWDETLYGSLDAQIGNDYQGPTFRYTTTLQPGESVTRIEQYLVPVLPPGDYWVVACVDTGGTRPVGEVIELSDDDNCALVPVCVDCEQPDFQGQTITAIASSVVAGETLHIQWTVVNAGDGDAQGDWWDQVYLEPVNGGPRVAIGGNVLNQGTVAANGGTYTQETDALVPLDLVGDYRPAVQIDVLNSILEPGGEGNNYHVDTDVTVNVEQPPLPDLRVQPFGPPPAPWSAWHPGDLLTLSWVVENAGELPTQGFWIDQVYLSTDQTLSADDAVFEDAFLTTGPLDPNATYVGSTTAPLPLQTGSYWLIIKTDANDNVEEGADEANNVRVADQPLEIAAPLRPNLVVESVSLGTLTETLACQPVAVQWVVRNQGEALAEGYWRDRVYLSLDEICDPNDVPLGQFTHYGPLGIGDPYTATESVTIPCDVQGYHYLVVVTDAANHLNEGTGENDNCGATAGPIQITQPDLPDLDVMVVHIPSEPVQAGAMVHVSWDVTNIGELPAEGSWVDKVYLSPTPTPQPSDRILKGETTINGPLDVGTDYYTGELSFALPPEPRAYWVVVVANATGTVEEGVDRANNTLVSDTPLNMVYPPRPDLVVAGIELPAAGPVGSTVDLTWTVANYGEAPAVDTWNEKVFASADGQIGGDQLLATFLFSGNDIAPGSAVTRTRQITVPNMPAGYHLVVCLDTTDAINETNENNNCDITAAPAPVLLPDLRTLNVTAPPAAEADQVIQITWQVLNCVVEAGDCVGTATAQGSWLDVVYLVPADPNQAEIPVGSTIRLGPLAPGTSYQGVLDVQVPGRIAGEFTVCVVSNAQNTVPETGDPSNNRACAPEPPMTITQPPRPNLVVSELTVPADGLVGQALELHYTAANSGAVTATGLWSDRAIAVHDPNDPNDPSGVVLGEFFRSGPLDPGVPRPYVENVNYPTIPGEYYLVVVTDRTDLVNEGLEGGEDDNALASDATFVTDNYDVSAVAEPEYSALGDTVTIRGVATRTSTGELLAGVPVALKFAVRGTNRVITKSSGQPILTDPNDPDWAYSYTFAPLPNEAGVYSVTAGPPGNLDTGVDDTFNVLGMRFSPTAQSATVFPGQYCDGSFTLINCGDIPLGNIQATITSAPVGLQAYVSGMSSDALAPLGGPGDRLTVSYRLYSADGAFDPGDVVVSAVSDPDGPAQATTTARVYALPRPLPVTLRATPTQLSAIMYVPPEAWDPNDPNNPDRRERQTHVQCQITNVGSGTSGGVEVRIPTADWLSLTSPRIMSPLEPGQSATVVLTLQPHYGLPTGDYPGSIVVVDTNPASDAYVVVPFTFTAVTPAAGSLEVLPEDEGTYYPNRDDPEGPLVAGVTVKLLHPADNHVVASGTTDSLGTLVLQDIPQGMYNLEVSKSDHLTQREVVEVVNGHTTVSRPFMPFKGVTYTWTVVPIEFEDEYIFTLSAVFQTYVPAPVVTVEPAFVDLTQLTSEYTQVDFTITNQGWITADDVNLSFVSSNRFELIPLVEELGDMPAHAAYTVPVIIHDKEYRKRGGVDPCGVSGGVAWSLFCGQWRYYGTPIAFAYPDAGCGGGEGGPWVPPPGGAPPPGGGPGNPYVNPPEYNYPPICEEPPPQGDEGPGDCGAAGQPQCPCQDGGAGAPPPENGTDPISLFSGEFHHKVEDLRIRGRGLDFIWARHYRSKIGPNTAQGNGWDFSYNIWLEATLPGDPLTNLKLHNGDGRADVFSRRGSIWGRDEFFIEIHRKDDGSLSAVFSGGGRWDFFPFDGSLTAGKLSAIVDRHGNLLTFEYDVDGRLWKIRDTLNIAGQDNRVITVGYNNDGLIETVTDFTGRTIRYDYYEDGDDDGSHGDLKSVTFPVVVGTPNGNDFPDGKTVTYTYSTGFADPRLNHNLLTITDGRRNDPADPTFGQGPRLINVYADTQNPEERNFDRVVRQVWGGDDVKLVYVPTVPRETNRWSVMTTIVNDRVGNVVEYDYDLRNRLIAKRQYTGRANPNEPSTVNSNRPENRLRSGDPPYFETLYQWNDDSRATAARGPLGEITEYTYEVDLDENASPRTRGNLRQTIRRPGSHPVPADQTEITESFSYVPEQGACCGADFVSDYTDARGTVTHHDYDDQGNRTQTTRAQGADVESVENWEYNDFGQVTAHIHPPNDTGHRRRDEYVYYTEADGYQNGYLKQEIVDAGGLALTTTYEYDAAGNAIRVTDPRGHTTDYIVNAYDQVVRESSRPAEIYDGAGNVAGTVRYERDTWYDANNNVKQIDVQNVNDQGAIAENPHLTTTFEYELLDQLIRKTEEVAEGHSAVTEYGYDADRNRTFVRFGEATNGDQPGNVVLTLYDERNLPYREIRGTEDPNTVGDPNVPTSTTQFNYDRNGNLVARIEGLEAGGHATRYIYDCFGRLKYVIDPMGNATTYTYDPAGNQVNERIDGELDDQPGGYGCDLNYLLTGVPPYLCDLPDPTNVRLSETTYVYDELSRLTRSEVAFFDVTSGAPIDDGLAVTQTFYTPNSLVWKTVDDRGNTTLTTFDTANRRSVVTDAKGNTLTYGYDANGNVMSVTEVEKSDLGSPDQVFTTTYVYDSLDRQVAVIDNVGNTNRSYYDSRKNRTRTLDALNHEVLYQYDGLNRLIRTIRDMDGSGLGSADPAAFAGDPADLEAVLSIVTEQGWDDSSRLVTQTDDNGNPTMYVYDGLNRKVSEVYADTTHKDWTFDAHGNNTFWTDANENQVTQIYDDADRLTRRDVVVGPGVSDDTTFEVYKYDGLSRLAWAEDDDTLVTRQYDSLGRVTRETQDLYDDPNTVWPTAVVTSVYDGVGNLVTLGYPSGLVVTTTYDELNRKKTISDPNGPIAEYWYVGPSRVERREYGNGTRSEWMYDGITGVPNAPNDFGVRHITRTNHYRISDGLTIDDRTYTWDRMGNKTQRKDIRAGGPRLTHDYAYDNVDRLVQSDRSDPNGPIETIVYHLDGVGNRTLVEGGLDAGVYTMDAALPEPADQQMNQYTITPSDNCVYDRNGDMTAQLGTANLEYAFDYRDRLSAILDIEGSAYAESRFDSLGRRVLHTNLTSAPVHRYVFTASWQELEIFSAPGALRYSVAYGLYIDDVILHVLSGMALYAHRDDLFSARALTRTEGQPVERYEYTDFGGVRFSDADGNAREYSLYGFAALFTGRWLEYPANFVNYRMRYYEPSSGLFLSRDPGGQWYDSGNAGHARLLAGR